MKFQEWDGKSLKGDWEISFKVDGIQARMVDGKIVSKNGKPLYNMPDIMPKFEVAEIFCGSWGETWSIVSASKSERRKVKLDEVYSIKPLDERLSVVNLWVAEAGLPSALVRNNGAARIKDPSHSFISHLFHKAQISGFEGIVLYNRERDLYIKVKAKQTVDVIVKGFNISDAKYHKGLLKEFITEKGKVGTGLTRTQRKEYCTKDLIGTYIEVECTEFTKNGKFRNPRFVRLRPDKS